MTARPELAITGYSLLQEKFFPFGRESLCLSGSVLGF